MNVTRHILVSAFLCSLLVACTKVRKESHTEEEVRALVVPGVSRTVVEKALGRPTLTMPEKDGRTMVIHEISEAGLPRAFQNRFTGFDIYYTNNCVERWFPTYSDRTTVSELTNSPQIGAERMSKSALNTNSHIGIAFYSVSETKITNGTYVDTASLQNVGYIRNTPDLLFDEIEAATQGKEVVDTKMGREFPTIIIRLTKAGARSLREFTQKELGKRVVITVEATPVAASYVVTPIDSGQFSIRFRSLQERDDVLLQLQKLIKNP